jgi:hypothetical protein
MRAPRLVAWVVGALLVAYPPLVYVAIYVPIVVPRLDGWRAVPAWVKLLLAVPYLVIVLISGEFGGWRSLVLKALLGTAALVAWQEVGGSMRLPAISHPDLSSPSTVAIRMVVLMVLYAAFMAMGRVVGLYRRIAKAR